jgi:hypothetical protein
LSNFILIVLYLADLAHLAVGKVQKELVGFAVELFGKIALHVGIAVVRNFDAYFLDYCGLLVWANVLARKVTGVQAAGTCWRYVSEKEAEGQGE